MVQKFKNLFSRKFILSALVVIGGVGTSLKTLNDPTAQIVGILVACVAAVVYNIVEGNVDVTAIEEKVSQAIAEIETTKKTEESEVKDDE
jgi:biopolymer transport protein ExbB/TolQ